MNCLKKRYLIFMCLVLGHILGTFAISTAPFLTSKQVQEKVGIAVFLITPNLTASFASAMIGTISLAAADSATYSASVEDKAISVWNLDPQSRGQFAKVMRKPVLDLALFGSLMAVDCFQSLA